MIITDTDNFFVMLFDIDGNMQYGVIHMEHLVCIPIVLSIESGVPVPLNFHMIREWVE